MMNRPSKYLRLSTAFHLFGEAMFGAEWDEMEAKATHHYSPDEAVRLLEKRGQLRIRLEGEGISPSNENLHRIIEQDAIDSIARDPDNPYPALAQQLLDIESLYRIQHHICTPEYERDYQRFHRKQAVVECLFAALSDEIFPAYMTNDAGEREPIPYSFWRTRIPPECDFAAGTIIRRCAASDRLVSNSLLASYGESAFAVRGYLVEFLAEPFHAFLSSIRTTTPSQKTQHTPESLCRKWLLDLMTSGRLVHSKPHYQAQAKMNFTGISNEAFKRAWKDATAEAEKIIGAENVTWNKSGRKPHQKETVE